MFLFRADVLLAELGAHEPELAAGVAAAAGRLAQGQNVADPALFSTLKSIPIDKAVMERSRRVAVVPTDPAWSDVGSWRAIFELMAKDEAGNARQGDVLLERASGNLVRSEHRLVALAGVKDLAVVETADAVLVGHLADSDSIRGIVAQLGRASRPEATVHPREQRPWGSFTTIGSGPGYRVRELVIDPDGRLSRQRHESRDEHWIIVSGQALAEVEGSERTLKPGASIFVPRGSVHRLGNAGPGPLRLIEVALGEVLSDASTERFGG
jgi:mannose-1-phosphate guanylyltransferase/mannose-6-phosphate isomerase